MSYRAVTTDPGKPMALPWLVGALLYWLATVLMHQEFSDWIVANYDTPWGAFVPRDHSLLGASLLVAGLAALLVRKHLHSHRPWLTTLAWVLLMMLATTATFTIMTTHIETIHFLQYAILAWLLARTFDEGHKHWPLLSITLVGLWLGIVDELFQYFYLTPINNLYIDFNDFALNLIGLLAGLLFYYGYHPTVAGAPDHNMARKVAATLWLPTLLVAGILWSLGRVDYSPAVAVPPGGLLQIDGRTVIAMQREIDILSSWRSAYSNPRFYVMGFWEWLFASILLLVLLALYGRWQRPRPFKNISARSAAESDGHPASPHGPPLP